MIKLVFNNSTYKKTLLKNIIGMACIYDAYHFMYNTKYKIYSEQTSVNEQLFP